MRILRRAFPRRAAADIYEVITAGMEEPRTIDWIVRGCQDRGLETDAPETAAAPQHLRATVAATPARYEQTLSVRGREPKVAGDRRSRRQPRQSRTAIVQTRAARVTLRAPWRPERKMPDVAVHAVLITEVAPPEGDEPVEWLLITSLPIDTAAQLQRIVEYYCIRCMIESGLRQLKDVLAMRPIYHQIEPRVKAHIFVAALALMLMVQRLLGRRLKEAGVDLSPARAMEALSTVRLVIFRVESQPERRGVAGGCPDARLVLKAPKLVNQRPPAPPEGEDTVIH